MSCAPPIRLQLPTVATSYTMNFCCDSSIKSTGYTFGDMLFCRERAEASSAGTYLNCNQLDITNVHYDRCFLSGEQIDSQINDGYYMPRHGGR